MIPNGFACFNFKLDNDLRVFGFGGREWHNLGINGTLEHRLSFVSDKLLSCHL